MCVVVVLNNPKDGKNMASPKTSNRLDTLASYWDAKKYRSLNETMKLEDYVNRVYDDPRLVRSAYQRLYDMIMDKGIEKFERYRKQITRFRFFTENDVPIFGLEENLEQLVRAIRGAAGWYGPEKRIILLHGPVGSSKSTICRALKRGMEKYSLTDNGSIYTFRWVDLPKDLYIKDVANDPMHEDPIKLLPLESRMVLESELNSVLLDRAPDNMKSQVNKILLRGNLNPFSRFIMDALLEDYDGNWQKVVNEHVQVYRFTMDESQRRGIGTFQPKDEKNQDSTELTGDINFALLGQYGVDSDPRAFSFDGEFQRANRGVLEFIEALKLAKEFLYDLLGACQERQVKPKKFSQVDIDVALFAHSVHGETPVPHEYDGVLDVLPIEDMADLDVTKLRVFSVNEKTREVELTEVHNVFSHKFEGDWMHNKQDGDVLTTTPAHSIYNNDYQTFRPEDDETSEILRVNIPAHLVDGKPTTKRWDEFFAELSLALVA